MQVAVRWCVGSSIVLGLAGIGVSAVRAPEGGLVRLSEHDRNATTWREFRVCTDEENSHLDATWHRLAPNKRIRETVALEHCMATTSGWVDGVEYDNGKVSALRTGRFFFTAQSTLQSCLSPMYNQGYFCGGMSAIRDDAHVRWHVAGE